MLNSSISSESDTDSRQQFLIFQQNYYQQIQGLFEYFTMQPNQQQEERPEQLENESSNNNNPNSYNQEISPVLVFIQPLEKEE